MKRKREEEITAEEVDPFSEYLSPQGPAFIGPTPQRDGIVLGLFDSLTTETPSKRRIIFGEIEPNLFQTPSKSTEAADGASLESRARGERTPLSVTKRNLFNQFITPKKKELCEEGTPTSALKGLSTPAFLRRDNVLDRIEEADETTPRPAPWKRRGLGRSLSAMIQSMKKDEDDRLDEEADIMRELEMEEQGIPVQAKPSASHVLVEDTQVVMPLGPDRELESEEGEEEEELGRDGQPRRVWKKKGLKRQTRRVISKFAVILWFVVHANNALVRPTAARPNVIPEFQHHEDSQNEFVYISETQVHVDGEPAIPDNDDNSDYASDGSYSAKKRKVPAKKVDNSIEKKSGTEKVKKKIPATAHANYQRLKIKGKGGNSGKPRGRFGRR